MASECPVRDASEYAVYREWEHVAASVILTLGVLSIVTSAVAWLVVVRWRQGIWLGQRSTSMMLVTSAGLLLTLSWLMVQVIVDDEHFWCSFFLARFFGYVMIIAPILVRLVQFHNKAVFSQMLRELDDDGHKLESIVEQATTRAAWTAFRRRLFRCCRRGKPADRDEGAERLNSLLLAYFSTSKEYGLLVVGVLSLWPLIFTVYKLADSDSGYGLSCTGCLPNAADLAFLVLVMVATLAAAVVMVRRVRHEPDPLEILSEMRAISVVLFLSIACMLFRVVDFGDLQATGKLSYALPLALLLLVVHGILVPLQVYRALKRGKSSSDRTCSVTVDEKKHDHTLNYILEESPSGREFFRDFCITEHSVENYYCWEAIERFKTEYPALEATQARVLALNLHQTFITAGAILQVNLSANVRVELDKVIISRNKASAAVPRDLFDKAQVDVIRLMRDDTFFRYTQSDIYRAWRATADNMAI